MLEALLYSSHLSLLYVAMFSPFHTPDTVRYSASTNCHQLLYAAIFPAYCSPVIMYCNIFTI